MNPRNERISRYLAYLLRHAAKEEGIQIDHKGGWANTEQILDKLDISLQELEKIVEEDEKGRYSFEDETQSRIRANQGHSIDVDLELTQVKPPDKLYHGTAQRYVDSIIRNGLESKGRHHVHLSKDEESAKLVGKRHGKPVVMKIDSRQMHEDGFPFFLSDNGVYLTMHVPPKYLTIL